MTDTEQANGTWLRGDGPPLSAGQVAAMVEMAARAPSVHNTQPWRFRVAGNALEIRADRSRRLAAVDPAGREMLISCGAAVYGARLAVRWLGYRPEVAVLPDPRRPEVVARIQLGARVPATTRERELLAAVPHRHTRRGPFTSDPLPPGLLPGIQHDAVAEGAMLVLVQDTGPFQRLAELVAAASRWQQQDQVVRAELARWTRLPGSPARDGIPARAYPAHTVKLRSMVAGGRLPPRDFDLGRGGGQAAGGGASPFATAVLLTAADTPADWVRAGQALYRMLLHAASRWVFASLNTEPLESPKLRELVRTRLALPGEPQVVLQLGSARTAPATPRRPVSDLLSWG